MSVLIDGYKLLLYLVYLFAILDQFVFLFRDEQIRKEALSGLQGGAGGWEDSDSKGEDSEAKAERQIPNFGDFMKFLMEKVRGRMIDHRHFKNSFSFSFFVP